MDDRDRWLFDPPTTHRLVLAHRGSGDPAVRCVVSDVVWSEVERVDAAARRLTRLLRDPGPVALRVLAAEVDALGEAAVGALVERATEPREPA